MKTWHVNDVMTTDVIAAGPDTRYRDLVALLAEHRINAVPVVDGERRILGMVSKADLLLKMEYAGAGRPRWFQRRRWAAHRKAAASTARELMTSPAEAIHLGARTRTAARRMDAAHVRQLPVENDRGELVGIVSRGDVLKEHLRGDDDVLADVRSAIAEATGGENTARVQATVEAGVVTLTGRTERWSSAILTEALVRMVPGVVGVVSRPAFDFDDRAFVDIDTSHLMV